MVENDSLNVIHPRAAGLDIHKVQITATVRIARAGKDADVQTRQFSAFPIGIGELVEWLKEHRVSAAVMEGTGIYWEAPFEALEEAGITPILVHAQHVKQIKGRKTDIADSIWLARICSFGLCSSSMVPPRAFRSLRKVSLRQDKSWRNEIVLWAVRWYCRYPISYRDLETMMTERGVAVDHSTIYRWVQHFAPEMEKRLRRQWRRPQSRSWRIDETYVKVCGKWAYLYRAVDKFGNTIDFYLSSTRNTKGPGRRGHCCAPPPQLR